MLVHLKGSNRWAVIIEGRMMGNFDSFASAYAALINPNKIEEKEDMTNVIDFREASNKLKTGGDEPTGSDWLSRLEEGDWFLCASNNTQQYACGDFYVNRKIWNDDNTEVVAVQLYHNGNNLDNYSWVIPSRFSAGNRKIKHVKRSDLIKQVEEEKEGDTHEHPDQDGPGDRPDQS
jgi:hypothetical protein